MKNFFCFFYSSINFSPDISINWSYNIITFNYSFLKIENSGEIFNFEKYRSIVGMEEMFFYLTVTFLMIIISNLILIIYLYKHKFVIKIEQM